MPALNLAATKDPRIDGERIYLRRLRESDVSQAYLAWMNGPDISQYLESRFIEHTMESLSAFVAAMADDPRNLFTGIFLKDGDRHVGNIKLGPIDLHHSHAEVGLLIGDRECWGKGYATEAIAAITRFAFEEINLHKIVAGAYEDNGGSTKAFLKAGYALEGNLRSHWWSSGRFQDGTLLGKVNQGHPR
jgi:[ribosomal protein S5]-alanine N-acetyltransferase